MEYRLLELDSRDDLELAINNLLAEGWLLHGDLVVSRIVLRDNSFDECFYQGMTRDLA